MRDCIKQYLKECKSLLPTYGKDEKIFMDRIQNDILSYSLENEKITYELIVNEFGTSHDLVNSYYEGIDINKLYKKIQTKKMIKNFLICFLIILLIISSYISIFYYRLHQEFQNSIPDHFEVTIEEIEQTRTGYES